MADNTTELGHPGGMQLDPSSFFKNPQRAIQYIVQSLDPNPDLRFPENIVVYDQMRTTDGQVGSVIKAATMPIVAANWRLEGSEVREVVMNAVKAEIGLTEPGQALTRKRKHGIVLRDHIREACLMMPFGFMAFEQVYKVGPPMPEQVAAGIPLMAHLSKLAPRMPRTIAQIHVGRDGGLAGITQTPLADWTQKDWTGTHIPVENLVFYTLDKEGADWAGRSILRTTYKHWMINEKLIRLAAQIAERNGMGVPVIKADEAVMSKADAEDVMENFRAGATAGLHVPLLADVSLMGVSGTREDVLPHIKYHDEKIAGSALAMFLTLGHDAGARSLGDTFVDVFIQSIQAVADAIAGVFTEHVIRDFVELNFGPDEAYPVLTPGNLADNKTVGADVLNQLVQAGIVIPDDALEAYARKVNGLPAADKTTSRSKEMPSLAPVADDENADELVKRGNYAGTLIRSGFDPVEAMAAAGLDAVKHLGLLPVTLQPPAPGTDLDNAVDPVVEPGAAPAPAAPPAATQLSAGHDAEMMRMLTRLVELRERSVSV